MKRSIRLCRDERGVAAIEMAIALPVLVTMIYGVFQLGNLFEANAGMQHALGEGARFGNLCLSVSNGACTLPTGTAIGEKVNSKLFGTKSGTWDTPLVTTSTASSGYVTVAVTYHQSLNFLFFRGPTIDVTRSKRVYLADTPTTKATCDAATTKPVNCSIYD
jgi:Flp pilus assembly protein TadG